MKANEGHGRTYLQVQGPSADGVGGGEGAAQEKHAVGSERTGGVAAAAAGDPEENCTGAQ